jgi:hypothetical protein
MMNTKKYILAVIVVFIVEEFLNWIIHGVILAPLYEATASIWRPLEEMNSMMWIMWIGDLIFSIFFVYIFTKGYENKGAGEGLRYGFLVGCLLSVPMAFSTYATQPIPFSLAVQWLIFGIIALTILGIVAAAVYKPAAE